MRARLAMASKLAELPWDYDDTRVQLQFDKIENTVG